MNPTTTTLTSGNMTATPTAQTTPQQMSDAMSANWKPTSTISATQIGTTTAPPTTTTTVPPKISPTVPTPQGTTTDANGNATVNPPSNSDIMGKLSGLGDVLGTEGTVKSGLENDVNLSGKQAQATSDYNNYNQAKIDQTNQIEAMRNQAGGTTGGNQEAITSYQRSSDAHISNLAYQAQISQGLYDAAQKTITDKYDAIFQPVKDQIDFYSKYITANNNDLTEKEKFDLTNQQETKKTELADVTKTANDIGTQLVQNQAPASVHDAIDKVLFDYSNGKITAADAKSQMATAAGKYGVDTSKTTQEAYQRAETNKLNIENAQNSGHDNVSVLDGNGNPISVPTDVAPYLNTSNSGVNYVDASTLQGTASDKKSIIDQAQQAGLKVILNKNSVLDLNNIKDANSKLDTATQLFQDIDQPDALARDLGGAGLTQLGILAQTNPKSAVSQSIGIIGLDILKGISGVQGFRGNQSAIQQVQDHLPKATDTADVVKGKIDFIRSLLDDRENALVGKPKNTTPTTVKANGQDWNVGQVYQDASGAKWTVDAKGNWSKQ